MPTIGRLADPVGVSRSMESPIARSNWSAKAVEMLTPFPSRIAAAASRASPARYHRALKRAASRNPSSSAKRAMRSPRYIWPKMTRHGLDVLDAGNLANAVAHFRRQRRFEPAASGRHRASQPNRRAETPSFE